MRIAKRSKSSPSITINNAVAALKILQSVLSIPSKVIPGWTYLRISKLSPSRSWAKIIERRQSVGCSEKTKNKGFLIAVEHYTLTAVLRAKYQIGVLSVVSSTRKLDVVIGG